MITATRRVLSAALATALTLVALALISPAVSDAPDASTDGCAWDDQWTRALSDLDEDPKHWTVRHIPNLSGTIDDRYDPPVGIVDPTIECELVDSVIRHEWMHLQQVRKYGDVPAWGDHEEIVADCGSWILGADATPYRDRMAESRGVACTGPELAEALALIEFTPSHEAKGQQ